MSNTRLETSYNVKPKSETKLQVVIGDAQIGTSAVWLGSKRIHTGDVNALTIGKGADISGKKLKVKSVVTDVNDKTNWTSVTYKLTGGQIASVNTLQSQVQQEGDSLVYRAIFSLI